MKLKPNELKEAAYGVEKQLYACLALEYRSKYSLEEINQGELRYYINLFKPKSARYDSEAWFGLRTDENQLARELSLLFTAEVLRDEQRRGG